MAKSVLSPKERESRNKKKVGIPTRMANPTGSAGPKNSNGPAGGSGQSQMRRYSRAKLFRAKGERII